MPKPGLRALSAPVALLCLVTLGGCSKSSGPKVSSPPPGVKPQIWTDYCARNASLTAAIQKALNGALTAAALTPLLNGIEQSITNDANASPDPTKTQFKTLVAAIDTVKVAVSSGIEPDYTQITAALGPIPTCNG